jgi:hypothetical protein
MSHTTNIPSSAGPAGGSDARLPLFDLTATRDGFCDGAWCPRSNDLVAELPKLFAAHGEQNLRVRRVVYHPTTWLAAPRRLVSDSRRVDLSPSSAMHPRLLRLFLSGSNRSMHLLAIRPSISLRRSGASPPGAAAPCVAAAQPGCSDATPYTAPSTAKVGHE